MDKVSMSYLLSFLRYQTKCVLSSYLDSYGIINFEIYLRSMSKAMADRKKKRGDGNAKILISGERKELFR